MVTEANQEEGLAVAMKLGAITLDCADPQKLGSFNADLTGRRIRETRDPDATHYTILADPDGRGPEIVLQRVAEPKAGKNRAHIDFWVADIEAEAQRAVSLGAAYVKKYFGDEGWVWMADPEGNEFDIVADPGHPAPTGL